MSKLNIRLVGSIIGAKPNQRKTIEALGFSKVGQMVEKKDTPQIRGMIETVKHLVEIEEI